MTKDQVADLMGEMYREEQSTREDGQKEYAHDDSNALANFERLAERLGITREQVLLVYLYKHMDGIDSWVNGHRSQREDVRGRIKDARVYLALLRAMVEETDAMGVHH
jgi:hypothetical protein